MKVIILNFEKSFKDTRKISAFYIRILKFCIGVSIF